MVFLVCNRSAELSMYPSRRNAIHAVVPQPIIGLFLSRQEGRGVHLDGVASVPPARHGLGDAKARHFCR
jgi:hypothetical protein